MDIILTDSSIRKFLETKATSKDLSQKASLCGPTFDRIKKIDGDFIYEIEAITNRVDTASAQGVAREIATILTQFDIPAKFVNDPYQEKPVFQAGLAKQFHFVINPGLALRFTAISLEKISVKPSYPSVQKFLENCGQRPLNNCIDITNELTLLYGLPSHIFDLDKLAAQNLHLRESQPGEKIITLDNKLHQLSGGDIVIEDGSHRLVDLCGVMGGQVAEVDEHTKNILLLVPVYQPQKIRRTSLSLQKRTLAAQLYEKQPDPELCLPVISKAIQLFKERAGSQVSSSLFDYYPERRKPKQISLDFSWLNTLVGIDLPRKSVISILSGLGFAGTLEKNSLLCTVPSWRYHDINIKEDLIEEVARIYGYFRLPAVLPSVNLPPEPINLLLTTELKAKKFLSNLGFHEIYNSSLVSLELLKQTNQDPSKNLKLKNALSAEFEYLRTTLLPSSLENHKHNQGKVEGQLDTYELANCYHPVKGQELPLEISGLSIVSTGTYLETKGKLEALLAHLKVNQVSFKPSEKNTPPYFDRINSAVILSNTQVLGFLGPIKALTLRNIGLLSPVIAIEINFANLVDSVNRQFIYEPISEYPLVIEDITISSDSLVADIIKNIRLTSKLIKDVRYLASFKNKHTFKVTFGSQDKNLKQTEINTLKDIIQDRFKVYKRHHQVSCRARPCRISN